MGNINKIFSGAGKRQMEGVEVCIIESAKEDEPEMTKDK